MSSEIEQLIIKRTKSNYSTTNNEIAFQMRDPNFEIKNGNVFVEIINSINEELIKVDGHKLSWEQNKIYKKMLDRKNISISAKTSFGKTWLSINAIKKIANDSLALGTPINFAILVPNDILESEILRKTIKIFGKTEVNISNEYVDNKSNIIVGTSEKIYPMYMRGIIFTILIVDEAHEIFYKDERSIFYKFLIDNMIKDFEPTLWMIGAFLKSKDIVVNFPQIKVENIFRPIGFKSLFAIEANGKKYLENSDISDIELPRTGLKLNYFRSVDAAINGFDDKITLKNYGQIIQSLIVNGNSVMVKMKKEFEELEKSYCSFNRGDINYDSTYNIINGIRIGVVLYHSKMPLEIKEFIFKAIDKGCIEEIFSTSAIMSGIDIPIHLIELHDTKISKRDMRPEDFFNLAGRTGRYKPGKPQNLGIVKIKQTIENQLWIRENKDMLISRNYTAKNPHVKDETYNIVKTIEYMKKDGENLKYFKVDPRIHPEITLKLIRDINLRKEMVESFRKIFSKIEKINYEPTNLESEEIPRWIDEEWVWEKLESFINVYTNKEVAFKGMYDIKKNTVGQKKVIRYFVKYLIIGSERKIFRDYARFLSINKLNYTFSTGMQKLSEIFNNEVKYALFSYFSHLIGISNTFELKVTIEDIMKKTDKFKEWISK